MQAGARLSRPLLNGTLALALLFFLSTTALSQSTQVTAPSPISSQDLTGTIAPRDLGDARLTHHYYAFGGNPGDVLITVTSRNLNGDVDVFTAGTLRPILKFALYAETSAAVTKGIFLRRHEDLILRVEARSPNDDEGTYQIRFGGTFQPMEAPLVAESERTAPVETSTRRTGRRVNSAGARINEPPPPPEEVAVVTPIPAPTPSATPKAEPETSPSTAPTESPEAAPPRPTSSRRARGRAATRRTTPRPEPTTVEKKETPAPDVKETEEAAKNVESVPAKPAGRGTGRRSARAPTPTPVEPEPPSGPRLVLEMVDGTRSESYMSTIKRVTIENNQIVVVRKDGKIDRTRLSEVARMTIEP